MKHTTVLLLSLFACLSLTAQSHFDDLNKRFIDYSSATLPEKVYIQTDKPYYAIEDTIWLRAFVVNAQIHQDSPSNYVYVELIDQMDSVRSRIKLRREPDGLRGYIVPDKKMVSGEYALRTYTSWMRNWDSDYFFQKNVTIGKVIKSASDISIKYKKQEGDKLKAFVKYTYADGTPVVGRRIDFSYNKGRKLYQRKYLSTDKKGEVILEINLSEKAEKQTLLATVYDDKNLVSFSRQFLVPVSREGYDVTFFPESGMLLGGIPQLIAFKAIGVDGLGVGIEGTIVSEGGTTIADLETIHKGMGKFLFCGEPDTVYYAFVKDKKGIERKFKLPKVCKNGVALQVACKKDQFYYRVTNLTSLPANNLYLITHVRGILSEVVPLSHANMSGKLNLRKTPEGVVSVVVADMEWNVLCERKIYVRRNSGINLQLLADSTDYGRKSLVGLHLKVKDGKNNGVAGSFALSVTDADAVLLDSTDNNICSELLLCSDLKGYVEEPGYYFTNVDKEVDGKLDLLLLTQGWCRYDVSAILKKKFPVLREPLERGQALSGYIKPTWKWKSTDGTEVVGFTNKWNSVIARLDSTGRYVFEGIEFPDKTTFTVNAVNKKGKPRGVMIFPDAEIYPQVNLFLPNKRDNDEEQLDKYLKQNEQRFKSSDIWKEVMLEEVEVTAKYRSKTGKFSGELAYYADLVVTEEGIKEEYPELSLAEIVDRIAEKVPGVTKIGEGAFWYASDSVPLFVDLVPVEYYDLRYYMAKDVASIAVFRNNSGLDGIIPEHYPAQLAKYKLSISIELKNGAYARAFRPSLGLAVLRPLGYQQPVEFYSPKYDVPESLKDGKTDYRTTVYWNPDIRTDGNGKASVSFYTTDMQHDMDYVLEGITKDGIPCRITGRIKSK